MRSEAMALMRRHVVISSTIGNALEWFDFTVFGLFAGIIRKLFFPAALCGRKARRLMAVPGVGPIIASPDARVFRSGRDFAAWNGLTGATADAFEPTDQKCDPRSLNVGNANEGCLHRTTRRAGGSQIRRDARSRSCI